jgi:hypothetical protein
VGNLRGLPTRRDVFIDQQDVVVLSVWHEDHCAATFRLPLQDVPRLSGLLAATLGDWVARATAAPQPVAEVAGLPLRRRLRLSPALLRQRRGRSVTAG